MMKVGVSVILYNSRCEFLLGKRKGAHGVGTYGNPGGKPEKDEEHYQTCIREALEETGIDLSDRSQEDIGFVFMTQDYFDDAEPYSTFHYAIMIDDDTIAELREPDKCDHWRFYDPLEILRMYSNEELFLPLQNLLSEFDKHYLQKGNSLPTRFDEIFMPLHNLMREIEIESNGGATPTNFDEPEIRTRDQFIRVFNNWFESHPYAGKVFLFAGPAGSGKGTQGKILQKRLNIPHISTGEMFRRLSREDNEKGIRIKGYMDRGEIIPPDLAFEAVKTELSSMRYRLGFILDGYPKDLESMDFLLSVLGDIDMKIDTVFYFDMAYELNQMVRNSTCVPKGDRIASETCLNVLAERLCKRLLCKSCELNYHPIHSPPKIENTCNACGNELVYRSDDQDMQTVKKRVQVFQTSTMPVITELEKRGIQESSDNVHKMRPVIQTNHHSHLDGKNLALLEDVIHCFHSGESSRTDAVFSRSVKPNLRQKVYPVQYLVLGKQAKALPEIYGDLDNFHAIEPSGPDESPEAFVTMMYGKKANYAYMAEMLRFLEKNVREFNARHKTDTVVKFADERDMLLAFHQNVMEIDKKSDSNAAIQFEYEEEIYSAAIDNVLDPYSESRVEFDIVMMESVLENNQPEFVIADKLQIFHDNSILHGLTNFEEYAIKNVPTYELHHGFDIPKKDGEIEPPIKLDVLRHHFDKTRVNDVPLVKKYHKDNVNIFEIGGIFIFEKEDRWAYRTNQFYDGMYETMRGVLRTQILCLLKLLNRFARESGIDGPIPLKSSIEIVHKIWRFDAD